MTRFWGRRPESPWLEDSKNGLGFDWSSVKVALRTRQTLVRSLAGQICWSNIVLFDNILAHTARPVLKIVDCSFRTHPRGCCRPPSKNCHLGKGVKWSIIDCLVKCTHDLRPWHKHWYVKLSRLGWLVGLWDGPSGSSTNKSAFQFRNFWVQLFLNSVISDSVLPFL